LTSSGRLPKEEKDGEEESETSTALEAQRNTKGGNESAEEMEEKS